MSTAPGSRNDNDNDHEHTDQPKDHMMNPLPPTSATMPFRVEPATPVPDDAVSPDAEPDLTQTQALPHLSVPPTGSAYPHDPALDLGRVTVRTGPRPGTVMLGLLALLVAAFAVVRNTTSVRLDFANDGPVIVAGIGVLLLIVGLTGVLLGRRHHRD